MGMIIKLFSRAVRSGGRLLRQGVQQVTTTVTNAIDVITAPAFNTLFPSELCIHAHALEQQTVSLSNLARLTCVSYQLQGEPSSSMIAVHDPCLDGFQFLAQANVGFHVKAFLVRAPSGQTILVIRGTKTGENIAADAILVVKEITSFGPDLMQRLRNKVLEWEREFSCRITCAVGHSLGAYLAALSFTSMERLDLVRVCFNGVFLPHDDNIIAVRLDGDIASKLCQHLNASVITLPSVYPCLLKSHAMDSVLQQVLQEEQKNASWMSNWNQQIQLQLQTLAQKMMLPAN